MTDAGLLITLYLAGVGCGVLIGGSAAHWIRNRRGRERAHGGIGISAGSLRARYAPEHGSAAR